MDLDDLKDQWNEYDRKLDASLRLNTRLLGESGLNKAESALKRLSRFIVVSLLVNVLALVSLGMFTASHVSEVHFFVPAVVLHIFTILLIVSSIHQLVALRSIDYGAPIVAIQKMAEGLRIQRIRTTKWTLFVAPLLWTPLLIVIMKGLFGLNAYVVPGPKWLAMNLLFGLAFIPLMVWMSRRFADRMHRSPFVQRLMNDIAGRNLSAATSFLNSVSRFEEDEESS